MNYKFKRVSALYTGGGIYVFSGILETGFYFLTDDCVDGVRILTRSTFVDDNADILELTDDALYDEWQTEFPYKDLDEKDSREFLRLMYTWMIQHPSRDTYCDDIDDRLMELNSEFCGHDFLLVNPFTDEAEDVIHCEYETSAESLQRVLDGIVDMYDDRETVGYDSDDCIYEFVIWFLDKLGISHRDVEFDWEKEFPIVKF